VSFSAHARRVRDRELPFGKRVSSLRSCVVHYRPLGFHATLAFLESRVGPLKRDEKALLDALAMLEESKAAWRREKEEFATLRRAEKAAGQRTLSPRRRNVYRCDRWHADPLAGALFAEEYRAGPGRHRAEARARARTLLSVANPQRQTAEAEGAERPQDQDAESLPG
jgi:hypothetical protein